MGLAGWLRASLAVKFIFFPEKVIELYPTQWELTFEEILFESPDGLKLHGWFFPGGPPNRTLIYFHGNAGNIGDRLPKIKKLHGLGMNVFLFDYRGYGGSEGKPSLTGAVDDSLAAYRWVVARPDVDPNHIILYGESLGGALALEVARQERHAAVILESTFTSVRDMAKSFYRLIPRFLVPDVYRSIDTIRQVHEPILILHGLRDGVVPHTMGKRLYEAAPQPKRFVLFPEATHSDIHEVGHEEYIRAIDEFLSGIGE